MHGWSAFLPFPPRFNLPEIITTIISCKVIGLEQLAALRDTAGYPKCYMKCDLGEAVRRFRIWYAGMGQTRRRRSGLLGKSKSIMRRRNGLGWRRSIAKAGRRGRGRRRRRAG